MVEGKREDERVGGRPRQLKPLEDKKFLLSNKSFVFVEERQELHALRVEADRAAGGGRPDDIC